MDHPALELARVPRRPPLSDLLIAGGLALWASLEALLLEGPWSPGVRLAIALGFTAPLVWRRRAPLAVLAAIVALAMLVNVATDEPYEGSMPFPSLLVTAFSVGLYVRPLPLAAIGGALAPATVLILEATGFFTESTGSSTPVDYTIGILLFSLTWAGGRLIRRRAMQLEAARAASGELAREAVAEERARIARELHDVVAHSVSIVSVQAGAAEQLLTKDPDAARGHMRAVQRAAQDALGEMRRLTNVLREDEASYAPQPGLARLGELVEAARGAGLPVELREQGERGELAPGVDLAAFRIAQEALTNVRKHAGRVATTISVRYGPETVDLDVENAPGSTGNGSGAGHGLPGMRERARLYGGTLDAGPDGRGGFVVHARLPREARPGRVQPS